MPYNRHGFKPGLTYLRDSSEWVIAIGRHRGIICGKEWVNIQRRLKTNAILHPRDQSARNNYALLTGMLVCKKCGSKMYTQPQNSGRGKHRASGGFTYMCERRKTLGKEACDCPSVSGKNLDAVIRDALSQYQSEGTGFAERIAALKDATVRQKAINKELAAHKNTLAKLEKKMYALVDRMADPDLTPEVLSYIKQQTKHLSGEIASEKAEIASLEASESKADQAQMGYEYICGMLDNFNENYGQLAIPQQRDILRRVIDRIEWDGEHADIFPFGR